MADGLIIIVLVIWLLVVIRYLFKRKKSGCGISCVGCSSANTCASAATLVQRYRKDHPRIVSDKS